MNDLTRRGFLGALAAAVATPALPSVPVFNGKFHLVGREIALSRPLVLTGLSDFFINDCTFYKASDFEGKCMIDTRGAKGMIVNVRVQFDDCDGFWMDAARDVSSGGLSCFSVKEYEPHVHVRLL